MTPEGHVVKACLDYLRSQGVTAWRNNTGATRITDYRGRERFIRYGHVGSSDIIGYLPNGIALFVECKTATGKLSKEPRDFLCAARDAGCFAVMVRSVEDLKEAMDEFFA